MSLVEITIHVDANEFGKLFSGMSDHDQVEVLRSMVEHMRPWRMQWDYIAIQLDRPENADIKSELASVFAWNGGAA